MCIHFTQQVVAESRPRDHDPAAHWAAPPLFTGELVAQGIVEQKVWTLGLFPTRGRTHACRVCMCRRHDSFNTARGAVEWRMGHCCRCRSRVQCEHGWSTGEGTDRGNCNLSRCSCSPGCQAPNDCQRRQPFYPSKQSRRSAADQRGSTSLGRSDRARERRCEQQWARTQRSDVADPGV
eukprot:5036527-Pleurochrysis_carterae.AAC.2